MTYREALRTLLTEHIREFGPKLDREPPLDPTGLDTALLDAARLLGYDDLPHVWQDATGHAWTDEAING